MIKMDLLGPSEFWFERRVLDLRPFEKLVHIALHVAGGTLSMTQLAEALWVVPTTASAVTLRGYLSKSRAKLVAAGGTPEQLTRTTRLSGGRTLVSLANGWDIDAHRFRQRAAAASQAYESGQFREARAQVGAALELWFNDPLPDAGGRPFAIQYIEELQGVHWSASMTRIKTDICLGSHREVVAELKQLTLARPNEGEVSMLLATAQYRSDLVPEAAEACLQAIAARELKGVDARRLQELQRAILNETLPRRGPLGW